MHSKDCMDLQDQKIAEAEEYDDFKTYRPAKIERAIKEKDFATIKDELIIYSIHVDQILYDEISTSEYSGLSRILYFLELAIASNNLHVIKAVWLYGVELYSEYNPSIWSSSIVYISGLISKHENPKVLKFLIKQIPVDNTMLQVTPPKDRNKLSGAMRNFVVGNLLDTAVYYNNLQAIEWLIPIQAKPLSIDFEDYVEDTKKDFLKISYSDYEFFYCDYYSKNTLYSNNPIIYAFDNGNTEAIDILIENGYKIDFNSLDFTYQLAFFAHMDTIKYLYKNFREEFKNLDMNIVLKSANHVLLKIMIAEGCQLKPNSFNTLYCYEMSFQEFGLSDYEEIKIKGITRCVRELVKQNVAVKDIRFGIVHSFFARDKELLDLLLSLYHEHDEIDVSPIFYDLIKNLDMLEYLGQHKKLVCSSDDLQYYFNISLKNFKRILSLIDFKHAKSKYINSLTRQVLNLNAVTSIKILVLSKFITIDNYQDAVDYIVARDSDKLLSRLISVFNNLGGAQKNYDI